MHWLIHAYFAVTGADNEPGKAYGFWSGFGGSVPDVLIITGLGAWYWQHTCHQRRCWRVGRHPAAGGTFKLCRRHHPDLMGQRPTLELMHRLHREHAGRQAAGGLKP